MSLLDRLFRRRLKFVALSASAQLPTYATDGSAGLDLYADEDVEIPFLKRATIKTNVGICLPRNLEAQVRSRSGHAHKSGVFVLNSPGTIDPDFAGGIGVILFNTEFDTFRVKKGDRIAQLVIAPFVRVEASFLDQGAVMRPVEDHRAGARGTGGFGSTGTGALAAAGIACASITPAAGADTLASFIAGSGVTVIDGTKLSPTAQLCQRALDQEAFDRNRSFVWRKDGSKEFLLEPGEKRPAHLA